MREQFDIRPIALSLSEINATRTSWLRRAWSVYGPAVAIAFGLGMIAGSELALLAREFSW